MKIIIKILLLIVLIVSSIFVITRSSNSEIKIGVITPLTEGAAYWGESTLVGIKMAEKELLTEGIKVQFIYEDGQLDPGVALNAAQKLVNIDHVSIIYSEFNPASIAVSSFLENKNVFHLYDSAAMSPLSKGPYNFKTYLDYQDSCADVSKYIKENRGIKRVGVLKMNIEHGELCLKGIQDVFGLENVFVESYNPGITDYRSLINKIKNKNIDAIFHASFQPETLASLRQLDELGINALFIGLAETITPDVAKEYSNLIMDDIFFGLPMIENDLVQRIDVANGDKSVADYNAAALGYLHMLQLGRALDNCNQDNECIAEYLLKSDPVESVGFRGFKDRVAKFDNRIVQFTKDNFVEVK